MKRQNVFIGVLLIGIGLFYFLQRFHLPLLEDLNNWPTLLIILGLAFFLQSVIGKDDHMIFPGVLLLGLGLHFLLAGRLAHWPEGWPMYTLIVGAAFLIRWRKAKKDGFAPGIILILISIFGFTYQAYQGLLITVSSAIETFWPLALIVIGAYLLLRKK